MGDKNRLSFGCVFLTHDGGRWVLDNLYPANSPYLKFGKIVIGNNNFIGAHSMINPGVTIGDNCIIAAGSIVTKNVPSGEVWGGVSAKYIMGIDDYENKLLKNKDSFDLKNFQKNKKEEFCRVFKISREKRIYE